MGLKDPIALLAYKEGPGTIVKCLNTDARTLRPEGDQSDAIRAHFEFNYGDEFWILQGPQKWQDKTLAVVWNRAEWRDHEVLGTCTDEECPEHGA